MALQIKMVVNRRMYGSEFLQTSHAPEPLHRPFSSSKRLVRILATVIQPTPGFLSDSVADGIHCTAIRTQFVCCDHIRLPTT